MNSNLKTSVILAIGVLAMSSAAIMIRAALAESVPPIVVAASRLLIATAALTFPLVQKRALKEYATLSGTQISLLVASGVLLGLHFASWITSLAFTSVASSVVLVTTTPLWIALISPLFLGERTPAWTWVGIGVAILGGSVIGLESVSGGLGGSFRCEVLALLGAVFAAGYLMIGRRVRDDLPLIAYLWLVYGTAALALTAAALASGASFFGYSVTAYLALIGLGLIPQLIGHSAANYAVRHLSATLVSITILGEPIGATLLALIILGEAPTLPQLIGGGLILTGIVIAAVMEERRKARLAKHA
ncbi:MAG: DMT family transporter [Anaerolineae bacterium]